MYIRCQCIYIFFFFFFFFFLRFNIFTFFTPLRSQDKALLHYFTHLAWNLPSAGDKGELSLRFHCISFFASDLFEARQPLISFIISLFPFKIQDKFHQMTSIQAKTLQGYQPCARAKEAARKQCH